jgi:hypothetical protein
MLTSACVTVDGPPIDWDDPTAAEAGDDLTAAVEDQLRMGLEAVRASLAERFPGLTFAVEISGP